MRRRELLKGAGAAAGMLAAGSGAAAAAQDERAGAARGNPIGVSTYSFYTWEGGERPDELRCLELAAELGFDGVELLLTWMRDRSNPHLQALKARAHSLGMCLMGMSTHQDFVSPDPEERKANVERTLEQLEVAYRLGIPTMRVNTGRWGTIRSFDELMANQGIEPALEGHTEDEAFGWVIAALEELLPAAAERGVVLGLENHWGLARTATGLLRIVEAIDSPWLRMTLDTGNFFEERVPQLERMCASRVPISLVQAKTYFGGGRWYTLDIDYAATAAMLRGAGYRGWISLEFEGSEDPSTGVPKSLELLRRHFSG